MEVNGRDAIYTLQRRLWKFNSDSDLISLLQDMLDVIEIVYDELKAKGDKK